MGSKHLATLESRGSSLRRFTAAEDRRFESLRLDPSRRRSALASVLLVPGATLVIGSSRGEQAPPAAARVWQDTTAERWQAMSPCRW